jgi:hypothetical protein
MRVDGGKLSQGGSDESTTYCGAFRDLTFQIGSSYLVVLQMAMVTKEQVET